MPVAAYDKPQRKIKVPPPFNVSLVAECTHHHNARSLFRISLRISHDRHRNLKQRRNRLLANIFLETFIIGMNKHGNARRQKFRTRRSYHQIIVLILNPETEIMKRARTFLISYLSLRNRRLKIHVPHNRTVGLITLALFEKFQKARLRSPPAMLINSRVFLIPIIRQAKPGPKMLKSLLILLSNLTANLDEISTADRKRIALTSTLKFQLRVMMQMPLTLHVIKVLHPAFSRQAVIIPTYREKYVFAPHPLITHNKILMRKTEHMAHMQTTANSRRRSIDNKGFIPAAIRIPRIRALILPLTLPSIL